jgi:hypothetical protein
MILCRTNIWRRIRGGLYAEVALASLARGIRTTARVVVVVGCWGSCRPLALILTMMLLSRKQVASHTRTPACSWKRAAW